MADLVDRLRAALADRYAFEREIGRGGMATVYRAQDLTHQRPVAVKVLHPYLAANRGAEDRGLEWTRRACAIDPEDPGVLYNVACSYALLGQTDNAMACLQKAVQNGFGHREWLENDSDIDSLRNDPRFQPLLKKL